MITDCLPSLLTDPHWPVSGLTLSSPLPIVRSACLLSAFRMHLCALLLSFAPVPGRAPPEFDQCQCRLEECPFLVPVRQLNSLPCPCFHLFHPSVESDLITECSLILYFYIRILFICCCPFIYIKFFNKCVFIIFNCKLNYNTISIIWSFYF